MIHCHCGADAATGDRRCRACRAEERYRRLYPDRCPRCRRHRPMTECGICRSCCAEVGLRECRRCRRVQVAAGAFYGRHAVCHSCRETPPVLE